MMKLKIIEDDENHNKWKNTIKPHSIIKNHYPHSSLTSGIVNHAQLLEKINVFISSSK